MQDETGDLDLGGEGGGGSADVFADTEADGGLGEEGAGAPPVEEAPGGLGGDGGTLDDLGGEAAINGEGAPPEGKPADPLADEAEPTPPAEEPTPEPEPPAPKEPKGEAKAKPKGDSKKKGTSERTYVVLQQFEREDGPPYYLRAIEDGVLAGNAEAALRKAYASLVSEDSGDPVTLVVIPEHYFKEKTVQAKVRHERAVEIS